MARIPLIAPDDMSEAQKIQYNRFPANLTKALLRTTCSTEGYLMLGASFPQGRINDKDREMIIIRVAALSKSAYERMQHLPLALQAGWGMAQIAAIEDGTLPGKRENAILNYVDECVHHVRVSETTFSQAAAFFSETQLAELTLLIGHYMMTARFLESLNIDLDHTATSWDAV